MCASRVHAIGIISSETMVALCDGYKVATAFVRGCQRQWDASLLAMCIENRIFGANLCTITWIRVMGSLCDNLVPPKFLCVFRNATGVSTDASIIQLAISQV